MFLVHLSHTYPVWRKSWNGFFPCVKSRFEVVSHQLIFSQFIDFDREKRIKSVLFHIRQEFFIQKKKFASYYTYCSIIVS